MRMNRDGNNSQREIPQMVVSQSQFLENPQGVIDALFSDNEAPSHISRWHNKYCARFVLVMVFFSLFCFAFINSQNAFLGLAYLVSGLFSLGMQNCFGLVGRLDSSCGDNKSHIYLIKLCYLIGFTLWLIPYVFILGCENACAKSRQNMLSADISMLYFMGFGFISMVVGFLIILPASIVNEITAVFQTLLCCNNSSYGALGPQNSTERGVVELAGGQGVRSSNSPPRFGKATNPLAPETKDDSGMRRIDV